MSASTITAASQAPGQSHRPLWFHHLMAFATICIWSFSFLFIVWINEDLSPLGVVTTRKLIFGVLVIGLLIWRRPRIFSLSRHDWMLVIALALVAGPIYHTTFAWAAGKTAAGEDRITSALLGLIMATVPIYASLLGWVFLRERLTWPKVAALALGIGGVAFVLIGRYGRIDLLPRDNLEGPIGVTLSAMIGGGIAVLMRANRRVYNPIDLVAVSGLIMVIACALLAPWAELQRLGDMPARGWLAITFLGLAGSGLAYITWAYALQGLQAGTAATYLFMASMLGALWAWIFRGQTVTWAFIPGAAMVLAGLLLMARESRNNRAAEKRAALAHSPSVQDQSSSAPATSAVTFHKDSN